MNFNFRNILPDAICVLLFAVIAVAYFYPADFDGRRLTQHDNGAADGLGVELNQYRDSHDGETPRWTNSVFGGMPTYQIAPSYDSTRPMSFIEKAYHLWLPDYVWYIFASMLGFYILLRAFDFRTWMAALGAVVWAFSSYFFIIIAAGHIWKVMTLAYIPPTIAGMLLCFKQKEGKTYYLWGCLVTALFASMQITSNHVQMTYYFLIPELLIFIGFVVDALRKKQMPHFLKATAALVVAAVIAVCLNASNLYHTYEYSKDTMRGKSELVKAGKTADQTDSGLERSYITAWSYGLAETWSFLVPNINGGASVPLSANPTAMKKADPMLEQGGIYGAFTQYWGEQPGTSGPVYLGALVCMLFVLGLIVIPNKEPMKWAMIVATILSILLSWGHNFMPFTDFFIDNVPMYAKFRTVSSILVVAEFTIPFIAMWGLKLFVDSASAHNAKMQKALIISTALTVACCLFFAVAPGALFGDCVSSADRNAVSQYVQAGYFDQSTGSAILASISSMRGAMLTADAWRSMFIIMLGAVAMYLFLGRSKKNEGEATAKSITMLSIVLLVICIGDMWMVNKRYLNDSMFESVSAGPQAVQRTEVDDAIMQKSGTDRNYRVLNLTVSTFNDNTTSYFYSSVGGYHAAKLRRYQELIEQHLSPEMSKVGHVLTNAQVDTVAMIDNGGKYPVYKVAQADADAAYPVLNMLNTRWFILGTQSGARFPVENRCAYGNAWFVNEIVGVESANAEIESLGKVNLRNVAVVDRTFEPNKSVLAETGQLTADADAAIRQTSLTANAVTYEAVSKKGGLVVFSEIYYPGWRATIDGKDAAIGRANYVLRTMYVPAGKHKIEMVFDPQSVHTTENVSYAAFGALILIFALALFFNMKTAKKEEKIINS